MKKFILVMAAVLGLAAVAAAQPRAIGIRAGYGAELSYQHTLGGNNFGELDLGWSVGSVRIGAAYDFLIAPVGPLNCFDSIPLQLSLDWKPSFNIVPASGFGWQGIALGIRYLF